MADYYSILGVERGVEQNDIRRAFRRLARQYHPDLNKDDSDAEDRFKEVNEAYEVLSDPDSRRKYDVHGDQWKHADEIEAQQRAARNPYGFRGGAYRGRPTPEGDLFTGLEDILGDAGRFRGSRRGTGTIRSETSVTVSLEEAYSGSTFIATYTVGGRNRRFEVDIPPGVDNDSTVRVSPEAGTEMLFRVSVSPSDRFRREGSDLYTDADIPFEQCILGGETQVLTLDGRTIWVKIPANSQNGQNIRLRGQGMPKLGASDTRGDLYVTVRPQMPRSLTDEQRDLIVKLQELRSEEE